MRGLIELAVLSILASVASASNAAAFTQQPGDCVVRAPSFLVEYDPMASVTTRADSEGVLQCRVDVPLVIRVGVSAGFSGNSARREMRSNSGLDALTYDLLADGTVLGDGSAGTSEVQRRFSPASTDAEIPIELVIPPHQDVAPGRYSDRLEVEIDF